MESVLAGTGFAVALLLLWRRSIGRTLGLGARPTYTFSSGDAGVTIARELNRARREILVPARAFSFPLIATVLLSAIRRGVAVHLLLDKALEIVPYPEGPLSWQNLRNMLNSQSGQGPDRVVFIIDRHRLVAGVFHFTKPAHEERTDSLVIVKAFPDFIEAYARGFLENTNQAIEMTRLEGGASSDSAQRPAA